MTSPRIAVFTKNRTNPAYEAARIGADRVAARLGATTIHYVPEQPDSVPQQAVLIARAIAERPDAAVFVPVHETAVNDAIVGFDSVHIPVFNIITPTTAGRRACFVGSDDRALGRAIARHLFAKMSGRGQIAILEGTPASATSRERFAGFRDALMDFPNIKVRLSLRGDYQRDVAYRELLAAADALQGIDAMLCANDTMALGALDAFGAAGSIGPNPLVVGVNALPEAVEAIASGRMLATADFNAMNMSCLATEAAVRHLCGDTIPDEIILPVQIVDASNCKAWNVPFEARALPNWDDVTAR